MNPSSPHPDQEFWKRKLAAYLHDPPDKCFDIGRHEDNARTFQVGAGLGTDQDCRSLLDGIQRADHFASAADRFVFPKGKCATAYNGQAGSSFVHPLSSTPWTVAANLQQQTGHLHEILKDAVGGIATDDMRVKFFLYWRRWLESAVTTEKQNAEHLAFSPADSRLPDHSIWTHMAVTSALAGCIEDGQVKPALLLFQLGPVQEFIAQARSTRDLWSGSYLLSWLIAHAMKAVSDQVGPDAIIFPDLRDNGIFDALHKDEIYATRWADGKGGHDTTWERMIREKGKERAARWLLTPTLPNRFLALVPGSRAEELAKAAEAAVQSELKSIDKAVWGWLKTQGADDAWKKRWDVQIAAFPQTSWAVQSWLGREACLKEFARLPANQGQGMTPLGRLQEMLDFAEKWLPEEDRDPRYYTDAGKTKLDNPGALWSAHYALVDAKLAARRNTRDFPAWNNPSPDSSVKDSLSGKEECIGDEKFWEHLHCLDEKLFPKSHVYGAMNLVKRLWCRDDKVTYLRERLGLKSDDFRRAMGFDSVPEVAEKNQFGGPYVAVLAMDGDEMGKWVSGEKTPEFLKQISAKAKTYLEPILKEYDKTGIRRLLTPSYHLQFSEALANFSTWLAEPIVEAFGGQLIYSGGDDVLAMLPADQAIACAEALRAVFRGETPNGHSRFHLAVTQAGYVQENAGYPLVVPGPAADASVGLAIGHCNAPLQMLVREAQKAEKRAKQIYGRSALAISLYKRSGEIIQWGCKWDGNALALMRRLTKLTSGEKLSGRFPYALAALLKPYDLGKTNKDEVASMIPVIQQEVRHVLSRQGNGLPKDEQEELADMIDTYLESTKGRLEDFINLFLAETFINRSRGEN